MEKSIEKWIRGAIPALLIHLSIGAVYCWSLLKESIAEQAGISVSSVESAFTLTIFFLGMSAAFGGRIVEKNVKLSTLLSGVFYSAGLCLTVMSVLFKSRYGILLSYGVIMGIGLGIGYLSPVKTLMLWFKENKGLATGIAICGFGLSKSIWSPYIVWGIEQYGIYFTLLSISTISFISIYIAFLLIMKPDWWKEPEDMKVPIKNSINTDFIKIWAMFFINITCGLCLISFEKNLLDYSGIGAVALIAALTAGMNAIGRFASSTISDFMRNRKTIYNMIFSISIVACVCSIFWSSISGIVLLTLFIINFGYGGGFSSMPALLTQYYDMDKISTIHGYILTAWSFAAIAAYIIMQKIYYSGYGYETLFIIMAVLFSIAFFLSKSLK